MLKRLFHAVEALFTWYFGKFISEQKEQDNVTKSKYADSEMGKARREKYLKDVEKHVGKDKE